MSFNFGSTGGGGGGAGTMGGSFSFGGLSGTGGVGGSSSTFASPTSATGTGTMGGSSLGTGGGFGTSTGGSFNFGYPASSSSTNTSSTSLSGGGGGGGGFNFGSINAPSTTTTTSLGGAGSFNFGATTTPATSTGGFSFNAPLITVPSSSSSSTTTTSAGAGGSLNFFAPTTSSFSLGGGGSSALGGMSTTGSGFGFATPSASQISSTPQNQIAAAIYIIQQMYNPENINCKFNYFFYNVVSEEGKVQQELQALIQKHTYIPKEQWRLAMERNPDPKRLVPVPARSFADLTARVKVQKERREQLLRFLQSLEREVDLLVKENEIKVRKQIEDAKRKHMELSHRVLKLMIKLEVQMQKGIGIRNEDIMLKNKLNTLMHQLHKPDQFRGRLNELMPQFNHIQSTSGLLAPNDSAVAADQETLQSICSFLQMQNQGIKQLCEVLQKDLNDMNLMKTGATSKSDNRFNSMIESLDRKSVV